MDEIRTETDGLNGTGGFSGTGGLVVESPGTEYGPGSVGTERAGGQLAGTVHLYSEVWCTAVQPCVLYSFTVKCGVQL